MKKHAGVEPASLCWERRAPPTFDVLIEIRARQRVVIHLDIANAVDRLLRGWELDTELRYRDEDGYIQIEQKVESQTAGQVLRVAGAREPKELEIDEDAFHQRRVRSSRKKKKNQSDDGIKAMKVYAFGIGQSKLRASAKTLSVPIDFVNDINSADVVVTLKNYYRRQAQTLSQAERQNIPVYVLRNNTSGQMDQMLVDLFKISEFDPFESAMQETQVAIQKMESGLDSVELAPQPAQVRRSAAPNDKGSKFCQPQPRTGTIPPGQNYKHLLTVHPFFTFEGPEGSGKSTQIQLLYENLSPYYDVLVVREPGGTRIGESVRTLLLNTGGINIGPRAETLLFAAARAQLVEEVIGPALEAGKVVLCDRYTDSTLAYQGYGRGQNLAPLKSLNAYATRDLEPCLRFYLNLPPEEGLSGFGRRACDAALPNGTGTAWTPKTCLSPDCPLRLLGAYQRESCSMGVSGRHPGAGGTATENQSQDHFSVASRPRSYGIHTANRFD